jgi:hypothetical protein
VGKRKNGPSQSAYYNGTPEQIAGYKAWAPDFDAQE